MNDDQRTEAQSIPRVSPEIPGTLRAVGLGALVGMVLAMASVGGALFLSGHGIAIALGLGGMAAFWGGLGFGAMLGGTLHLVRHTEEPHHPVTVLAPRGSTTAVDASRTLDRARPTSEVA